MRDAEINLNYRRLMEIKRCNNFNVISKEDVAQHSFYVTLYSTIIAKEYNDNVASENMKYHPLDDEHILPIFNVPLVMEKALFHDIEETFVSDIPHNVKHQDAETNKVVESAVANIIDKIYEDTFARSFIEINKTAKDGFEGSLIDMIDMLELGIYCAEEYCKGNSLMTPLLEKAVKIVESRELFDELMRFSPTFEGLYVMLKSDNIKTMYANALNID